MPRIVSIKAQFSKTIQPSQYEPVHAELNAEVAFGETESADIESGVGYAADLLIRLRNEVYRSVGRTAPGDVLPPPSAKIVQTAVDVEGAKGGKAKKTTKSAPTGAETADFDGVGNPAIQAATPEQTAAAATATANKVASATGATPAPAQQTAPAVNVKLTLDELLTHLNALVSKQKVKVEEVKALYPTFKVTRVAELKEDQVSAFKVALDQLEKQTKDSAGVADL